VARAAAPAEAAADGSPRPWTPDLVDRNAGLGSQAPHDSRDLGVRVQQALAGGDERAHARNRLQGKRFVRQRLAGLLDAESPFVEDGLLANCSVSGLPADGVVTGFGQVHGRHVAVVANDSTVKAGSWGAHTVEKILRLQERVAELHIPIFYLVDSAGARITDQLDMFPGRRHAGRIFHNQIGLSGVVPQICVLLGPSAAGGAYIPAFCDVVFMVDKSASMYLGSPRMAEMVIGEKTTLEEMGGARMHCEVSGCGDFLCPTEDDALAMARAYLAYLPQSYEQAPPATAARPARVDTRPMDEILPEEHQAFDMMEVIEKLCGLARLDGRVLGIVASQPCHRGGVLFADSADKATRFVSLCDAFNLPLLFLADVPGFMIGKKVERAGIIRHGAKMIAAVSQATVPKISVIVRKAYGAGLYAMCGPGFEPDACLALPQACIAVMGAKAAVNAVYYHKIQDRPEAERPAYVARLREGYNRDVDIYRLASELHIDAVVAGDELRDELARRFALLDGRPRRPHRTPRPVTPV
jgi:acetyl-CoA carboxylase carboxyltransferase component